MYKLWENLKFLDGINSFTILVVDNLYTWYKIPSIQSNFPLEKAFK